jgi:putative PIN family toxin of toxin-antitoxin system
MALTVVIDTNVFVGALMRGDGVNRAVLEMCFRGDIDPLMGDALFYEYEDLLARDYLFSNSVLDEREREAFLDDFCSVCRWMAVHYRWRPNLKDEADNHVLELALAGNAGHVVTWNKKDYRGGDMVFPDVAVMTPPEFIRETRTMKGARHGDFYY